MGLCMQVRSDSRLLSDSEDNPPLANWLPLRRELSLSNSEDFISHSLGPSGDQDDGNCYLFERGLSLSALNSIMDEYGRQREESKPHSPEKELIKFINSKFYGGEKEKDAVGAVNIYVCSSPEQDVCDLIGCIAGWQADWEAKEGKKHMTFYYYVDRLCAPPEQQTSLEARKSLLRKARMVVFVLPKWGDFGAMSQAACIWEIALVAEMAGTRFDITFPREQRAEFEIACSDFNKFTAIIQQLKMINYEKAVAELKGSGRTQYDAYIKYNRQINILVLKALRSWLITTIKDIAVKALKASKIFNRAANATGEEKEEKQETIDQASLLYVAGRFTREVGEFSQSVKFLSRAVELTDNKKLHTALRFDLALSLAENQEHSEAQKIMNELLRASSAALSEEPDERRQEAQLTTVKCLVAQGNLNLARSMLKRLGLPQDSILKNRAISFSADVDSREGKYTDAENKFRKSLEPLEHPTPTSTDTTYSNALNMLMFVEHLMRKACDTSTNPEDHKRAMNEAKNNVSTLRSLVHIFSEIKGERHPVSQRAADMLLELTLKVNPKQFEKRYLDTNDGMLRVWSASPERTPKSIVVMHWNILADALAFPDLVKNGFACDNDVLHWKNNRKDKIISEIVRWDPDVLGLVELDHYDDLRSILSRFGYESVWLKKNRDFYKDGGAIFWKKDRLRKVDEVLTPLKKKDKLADQVLVSVKLALVGDEKKSFAVGCVHLKSTKKAKGEAMRLDQAKQVLNIYEQKYGDVPKILLADLNGESSENVTRDYEPKAYPFIIESSFQSAYKQALGAEPDFTSWKYRAEDEFKYTIDFVFHTKEIVPKAVLLIPNEDQIDSKTLLPSMKMPSDHLPLVAELEMPWG